MVSQLKVVPANTALRLRAILDFQEEDGTRRVAGDEWLFEGPGTEWGRRGDGGKGRREGERGGVHAVVATIEIPTHYIQECWPASPIYIRQGSELSREL